jgi:hypothetical protein
MPFIVVGVEIGAEATVALRQSSGGEHDRSEYAIVGVDPLGDVRQPGQCLREPGFEQTLRRRRIGQGQFDSIGRIVLEVV